jgi:predicted RNA-binding protein with PIN domain
VNAGVALNRATFIIDGYNAMRSILSRAELGGSLENARALLEARLKAFRRASPGARICLVYDGAAGGAGAASGEPGFEVRFSRPPRTADDLVIDLCRRLEGSPGLHVVTSDVKDIASRVASLRIRHLGSEEFGALVERRIRKLARPRDARLVDERGGPAGDDEKPRATPPGEVSDWVRKFGFEESGEEGP